jgi:hypothetical protein
MRCGLLGGFTSGYMLTSLLPAVQGEWRRRRQPIGQGGEGLPAETTKATSHPNAIVPVITRVTKPLPMAHDRALSTDATLSREKL